MSHTDADAIRAVLAGEIDRYAELVDRYQDRAIRIAFTFVGNHEDARDVAQEAFVSAYQGLRAFRGTAKFSTWLYRIIMNRCKDVHRRRARHPVTLASLGAPEHEGSGEDSVFADAADPGPDPEALATSRELGQQLTAAIRELPMNQRTAFLLHHVHGFAIEEAAGIMECRVGTVKSHLFRATSSLRKRLTPWLTQEYR
jgi:RNA polymerase sigma-70 factor (ECF subfamily)